MAGAREPDDALSVVVRVPYAGTPDVVDDVADLLACGDSVVLVLTPPGTVDLAVVEALARLALAARRLEAPLQVRAAGAVLADLADLVELTGLSAVVAVEPTSGQPQRQPEAREELGTEKVVEVHDSAR